MKKKNLLDDAVYEEVVSRINLLASDTKPQWGQMDSAQMLAHCCEVQLVTNGAPLLGTPFLIKLIGPLIRMGVVGERAYPRNTRTHPQYTITDERDFDVEKDRFLGALKAYVSMPEAERGNITHPIFGKLSRDESGWAMYKHHDHHLQQFGV